MKSYGKALGTKLGAGHMHIFLSLLNSEGKAQIRKQTVIDALLTVVGTLGCHDSDDNENVKKAIV